MLHIFLCGCFKDKTTIPLKSYDFVGIRMDTDVKRYTVKQGLANGNRPSPVHYLFYRD